MNKNNPGGRRVGQGEKHFLEPTARVSQSQ
jgi:hypothetical protein